MGQKDDRGRAPLDEAEVRELARWVEDDGEPGVLKAIGISRHALARSIGAMRVLPGTRSLVRSALAARN